MRTRDKERAIRTLDNMRQIVKNDMLTVGEYITQNIVQRNLAEQGAICGGRKACAIGSMLLAYGDKPVDDGFGYIILEGTEAPSEYAARKPALKAVLDSLNAEAEQFIEKNPSVKRTINNRNAIVFEEPIERLFEGAYGTELVDRDTMLKLITGAKRRVRAL
jgi:hypothetical protein